MYFLSPQFYERTAYVYAVFQRFDFEFLLSIFKQASESVLKVGNLGSCLLLTIFSPKTLETSIKMLMKHNSIFKTNETTYLKEWKLCKLNLSKSDLKIQCVRKEII